MVHERKIKILSGMEVYSPGFNRIMKDNPDISCQCNEQVKNGDFNK
jgi:hypothetical protein